MATRRFASRLTDAQMRTARAIEAARLASISQAVKAFERGETAQIRAWLAQLQER